MRGEMRAPARGQGRPNRFWTATAVAAVMAAGVAQARAQTGQASGNAGAVGENGADLPVLPVTGQAPSTATHGFVAADSSTATKTKTPLIKTPQSISVVTAKQMTDTDSHSLNEALRYTSGVQTETRGPEGSRYDLLTVRGFDPVFYLDGLPLVSMNYIAPQIDPYLLQEVDVLKGPSSPLYGQASPGGLVNQVSKTPTDTPYHEVGFEVGNYSHVQGFFDLSDKLNKDGTLLYRVTGTGLTESGQAGGTKNQRIALAPSITWKPDADTRLTLTALYQYDPAASGYNDVPAQGTVLPNPFGTIPYNFYAGDYHFDDFNRTQVAVGYRFEKKLDSVWTFRSAARYFHTQQKYASVYGNGLEADYSTFDRGVAYSQDRLNSFSFDNSAEADFATGPITHKLLFGLDAQYNKGWYNSGFDSGPSIDIWQPDHYQAIAMPALTMTDAESHELGLYAQDQIGFGRWVLDLAGQESWAQTQTETSSSKSDNSANAFTGKVGLLYLFDSGVAPYVSYSTSFVPQLGTNAEGGALVPVTAKQTEVGVKYKPPGLNALFTAALFNLDETNVITYNAAGLAEQSGEARSRGAELEAKVNLTRQLNVTAAYTYLYTAYTNDPGNGANADLVLPSIPRNAGSLFSTYHVEQGALRGVTIGGGVRYIGFTYNSDNSFKVPDTTLVDATLRYDLSARFPGLEGLSLSLTAHNLLNREYVASCYYGSWCGYGYGRQIYGGVSYRW